MRKEAGEPIMTEKESIPKETIHYYTYGSHAVNDITKIINEQNEQSLFEQYLRKQNLSENTVTSYLWTIKYYTENYEDFSKENLLAYKGWLLEYFKPKTVNLRIQAINKYLVFIGKEKMQLKQVKVQQKNFLENVISNVDYQYFKAQLKADGN